MKHAGAVCIFLLFSLVVIPLTDAGQTGTNAPSLLWVKHLSFPATADNSSGEWGQPTVADGVVYVGSISAINFGLPIPLPNQPPYNPDNVWSDFYAFNASTGDIIWNLHDPADNRFIGASVVSEGKVFFSRASHAGVNPPYTNEKAVLAALNVSNGGLIWNYTSESDISAPIVSNGIVYVNSKNTIHALNESNGNEIWEASGYSGTLPVVHDGILYLGSFVYANTRDGFFPNYNMNALNAENGKFIWNYSTRFWVSTPAVFNGVVYFGADTDILALNALTGAKLWNYTTPHTPRTDGIGDTMTYESSSPTVNHGIVYIFSVRAGTLLALKASNGAQLWSCSRGIGGSTDVGGHPTVVNGFVYVNPGTFSVLNAFNGQKVWEYPLNYYNFPVIDDNVAYYGMQNGGFYALKLPSFSSAPTSPTIVSAWTDEGQSINLSVDGNISSSQISNAYITSDNSAEKTFIYLTVAGTSGSAGFCNMTIPKNAVPHGETPTIYIDDQKAESQGYTQDAGNYYVWYNTQLSNHEITILFIAAAPESPTFLQMVIIGVLATIAILAVSAGVVVLGKRKNYALPNHFSNQALNMDRHSFCHAPSPSSSRRQLASSKLWLSSALASFSKASMSSSMSLPPEE